MTGFGFFIKQRCYGVSLAGNQKSVPHSPQPKKTGIRDGGRLEYAGHPVRRESVRKFVMTAAALAIMAAYALFGDGQPVSSPAAPPTATPPAMTATVPTEAMAEAAAEGLYLAGPNRVGGVAVVDNRTGRTVWRGVVDLGPVLERIAAGERHPHPNDGSIYYNRSRALPRRENGYYREYVVPTPGLNGPGPQRLVVGRGGGVYYTPDHYDTFIRIDAQDADIKGGTAGEGDS